MTRTIYTDILMNPDRLKGCLKPGCARLILVSFIWANTPQGFDYWNDIYAQDELTPEAREHIEEFIKGIEDGPET